MQILSTLYGSDVVETCKGSIESYGYPNIEGIESDLRDVLLRIDPEKFYNLIHGIHETLLLSYVFSNDAYMPWPKTCRPSSIVLGITPKLSLYALASTLKNSPFHLGDMILANLNKTNRDLARITLAASLFRANNVEECWTMDDGDVDESQGVQHHDGLPASVRRVFQIDDSSVSASVNKYIYGTLGWGNFIKSTAIFSPEIIKEMEMYYKTNFY